MAPMASANFQNNIRELPMKKLLACLLASALLTGTALTAEAAKQSRLVKAKVLLPSVVKFKATMTWTM